MPKAAKKQLISVNTEEPLEEEKLEIDPLADEESETEEGLEIDDEEIDPFKDKWEQ